MERADRSFADYQLEQVSCIVAAVRLIAVVQNVPLDLVANDDQTFQRLFGQSRSMADALYLMRTRESVDQRRRYIESVTSGMRERVPEGHVSFNAEQIETSLLEALNVPPAQIPKMD